MQTTVNTAGHARKLAAAARRSGRSIKPMTPGRVVYLILAYLFLLFIVLVSVYPIVWVIMSSFKSNAAILGDPFSLPDTWNFDAYVSVLNQYSFGRYAVNSLITAGGSTIVSIVFYAMAAYVIAKYNFPLKNFIYVILTLTLLVPGHTKTQPIFQMIMNMGLYDTRTGLWLVYLSGGIAMSLFVLKANFASIPRDLNEAASIDGSGFFRTFWQINLPLARNGLATAGILMFLGNWNESYHLLPPSPQHDSEPAPCRRLSQVLCPVPTNMGRC